MVFSSTIFLFGFLPLSLLVYYVMPLKGRNLALFLLSMIFYGFGEPTYIVVMLFSITVAYLTGFPIGKYRESNPRRAKAWLAVSLCLNLALLLFFKYTNFFIENLALIPPLSGVLKPIEGLTLPIGISFYTFQIMSYSIDLYRGDTDTNGVEIVEGAVILPLHIFREGACKDQFFPGTGVTEGQACGMQCLPLHAEPLVIFRRKFSLFCPLDKQRIVHAIQFISHHGIAQTEQGRPDLVHPACKKTGFYKGAVGKDLFRLKQGAAEFAPA